ncbi:MAG: hemolysin family protein [Acidimicrobiales bacterium]
MAGADNQPPPAPRRLRRLTWGTRIRQDAAEREESRRRPQSQTASEQERLIIERLADLRDMEVKEVMTPRVDVVALTIPVTADDVATAVRESGHSCFPVLGDGPDDLIGVLFVNDLFRAAPRRLADEMTERSPLDISRRLRQPHVVPETRQVLDALSEMRRLHRAFAVVVDEYGGVAGVLTVKDLLESLVGDLQDEFDADEGPEIVRVDVNRWLVDGRTSVDDVHDRLGIELPEGEYVTIGGLLFDGFGHIPTEGEQLAVDGWELRVVELDKRRIAKVLAKRMSLKDDAADRGGELEPNDRPGNGSTPRRVGTSDEVAPSG